MCQNQYYPIHVHIGFYGCLFDCSEFFNHKQSEIDHFDPKVKSMYALICPNKHTKKNINRHFREKNCLIKTPYQHRD